MDFEEILYEVRNGVAWITINRPEKMNSFRGQTGRSQAQARLSQVRQAGSQRSVSRLSRRLGIQVRQENVQGIQGEPNADLPFRRVACQ